MIKLYEFALSGNCHKVRLLLSLLGVPYERIAVDGAAKQHKTATFLAMNPLGQVPVLVDGDVVLRDSQAILVYLARRYGGAHALHWLPEAPAALANVIAWLSVANSEVSRGPAALRLLHKWGRPVPQAEAEALTRQLLDMLESRLQTSSWLASEQLSIADIALYPYVALAPEGLVELARFPAICGWLARIEALDGYVAMPGILPQVA
ncbi:glutathione S-transferase [Andreprevotia lacus DSM 23236]|jgi:glutathione S-transferase|uniref:Glutathione S-transferase n=1 Tax=Andreprevotia lacus DSM 23236 TaxID=1121001 RepID=A0A1W1XJF8_9NEIS|nr:glutathione S-transferase family protein [Andreprevotia lacus]SMC24126.1 glutathione S-transferase [Andreprevotia lacus DSM 23236]